MNTPNIKTRGMFIAALSLERLRQEKIHPGAPPDVRVWSSVLAEEVGEVCRALNDNHAQIALGESFHRAATIHLAEELMQVAAVCCRVAEYLVPESAMLVVEEKLR